MVHLQSSIHDEKHVISPRLRVTSNECKSALSRMTQLAWMLRAEFFCCLNRIICGETIIEFTQNPVQLLVNLLIYD